MRLPVPPSATSRPQAAVEHEAADGELAEQGQEECGQDDREEHGPDDSCEAQSELDDEAQVSRGVQPVWSHGPVVGREAIRQDRLQVGAQHVAADGEVGEQGQEERRDDAVHEQGSDDGDQPPVVLRGQAYAVVRPAHGHDNGPALAVDGGGFAGGDATRGEVGRSGVVAQERLQARCTGGCGGG